MVECNGVFERKEVKYRLDAAQYKAVLSAMKGRLAPDAYGSTLVRSMYFDTEGRDMIARSIEKPLYKEKLRVRSYGTPAEDDAVFVEIKKKYDGVVYKRRVSMSYAAAKAYLKGVPYAEACVAHPIAAACPSSSLTAENIQIAAEIDALMHRWGPLWASVMTTCVRTAYGPVDESGVGCADEGGLRITFDTSLGYCGMHVSRARALIRPLIAPDEVVMEVKLRGPYPLWLVSALDECAAYPSSFSKYGEAYKRCSSESRIAQENVVSEVRCA